MDEAYFDDLMCSLEDLTPDQLEELYAAVEQEQGVKKELPYVEFEGER